MGLVRSNNLMLDLYRGKFDLMKSLCSMHKLEVHPPTMGKIHKQEKGRKNQK
jgi:hypothetical protein